jgi:hypothetical protein
MVGPVAQAFAASGPLAKRFTDEDADTATAVAPWAASYTAPAAPAPKLKLTVVVPMNPKVDTKRLPASYERKRRVKAIGVAEGTIAFDADKDLGDVTIELRDHHFARLDTMTVHVTAGHTEAKLPRTNGVESVQVRAGAFTGRADLDLQGVGHAEFGAK